MIWAKGANSINRFHLWVGSKPLAIIELVLAIGILGFGLYLLTPLFEANTSSTIGLTLSTDLSRTILAFLFTAPSFFTLWGFCCNKNKRSLTCRSVGALGIFNAYLFVAILRIVTGGWIPAGWIFLFALSLIAGVIHLRLQYERKVLNNGNTN